MRVIHETDSQATGFYAVPANVGSSHLPAQDAGNGPDIERDRRVDSRFRTVYRIAPVRAGNDRGLARVRNISDGGMRLNLALPVLLGDSVFVALSDSLTLRGTVVWTNGDECGLKFEEPIDSIAALRDSSAEARGPGGRPPRVPTAITALASTQSGKSSVYVRDISQRGMKVAHDGSFAPGLNVKLTLPSGIERRGVVRWSEKGLAGILLAETLSQHQLANVGAL